MMTKEEGKKCTWSQYPKWFLERRADPANKDLTDNEIRDQYYGNKISIERVDLSFDDIDHDKLFNECYNSLIGGVETFKVL
jgi:hypothetical protein